MNKLQTKEKHNMLTDQESSQWENSGNKWSFESKSGKVQQMAVPHHSVGFSCKHHISAQNTATDLASPAKINKLNYPFSKC